MRRSRSSSMLFVAQAPPNRRRWLRLPRLDLVERIEARAPADAVDGLEAAGRHEPGARIRRHAVARPLLERRPESVVQRLLGEVEVAEQADQRREDAPRFGAIDGLRLRVHATCGFLADGWLIGRDHSSVTSLLQQAVYRSRRWPTRTPTAAAAGYNLWRMAISAKTSPSRARGKDPPRSSSSITRWRPSRHCPVLEVVSGVHIQSDLTLGLGTVVHDYLAR